MWEQICWCGPSTVSLSGRGRRGLHHGRAGGLWEGIAIPEDGEKPLEGLKQGSEVISFLPLKTLWM